MLERKLARESFLRESYVSFMREYESLGHMVSVTRPPQVEQGQLGYYIPHHCVTKKFRVVFDCSCKTDRGISYNEVQQMGEKLQRDLFEIIMCFRRHQIAFSADIKMMFRRVRLARYQWDSQRIFWRLLARSFKIWRASLDCDQEVPDAIRKRWHELWQGIKYPEQFHIPRWLNTDGTAKIQIHGFSYASTTAYRAVLYARVEQANGKVTSQLITSKTGVAPLKMVSIPRLELAGAELLGRLLVELLKAMG